MESKYFVFGVLFVVFCAVAGLVALTYFSAAKAPDGTGAQKALGAQQKQGAVPAQGQQPGAKQQALPPLNQQLPQNQQKMPNQTAAKANQARPVAPYAPNSTPGQIK